MAKPARKNTITSFPTNLFGKGVLVLDRPVNSHRKTSSPRQIAHEAHSMASQKQLEDTRIVRKSDSSTQISTTSLAMVAQGRQCPHRPTITPHATCSANLYRRIKRRVGLSLKRVHCQRNLVPDGKQTAHKLPGAESSFYCVNISYLVDQCICPARSRSRQTLEKNVLSWALTGTGSVFLIRQVS